MNELIPVTVNDNNEQVISGRALHEFLEVKTPYTQWFERMIAYGFVENTDFITLSQKSDTANGGYTERFDHAIKIDMAKEISMIQRNAKGKQARRYFIEVEKAWNDPDAILKRANKLPSSNADLFKTMELISKTPTSRVNLLLPVLNILVPGEYERFMGGETKANTASFSKHSVESNESESSISQFLNDYGSPIGKTTSEVYRQYQEYCSKHKIQPIPHIEFSKKVKWEVKVQIADKKIQSKKCRVFI